jgi:hypothetical protein
MSYNLNLPNIPDGPVEMQVAKLRSYLHQTIGQLNFILNNLTEEEAAETTAGISEEKVNALTKKAVKSHAEDKNNPHGVTAAQVGARPDTWLPTPGQIGAARSGYGYGESANRLYFNNDTDGSLLEAELDKLLSTMANREIKQIAISDYPNMSGSTYYGSVYKHMPDYAVVRMYSYEYSGRMALKVKSGGKWDEWCWSNPPMALGMEYCTEERYNGKKVYTKLVDLGTLPDTSTKTVTITSEVVQVISMFGSADSGKEHNTFPVVFSGSIVAYAYTFPSEGAGTRLTVKTLSNLTAYAARFIIRYTKE